MDWQGTNSSALVRWSDRITPDHAQQTTPRGVAVEYLVDLCNETGADAWVCLPHLCDDEFVREFARLVLARLRPESKVYLEYSNETWNTAAAFQQGVWVKEQAKLRGIETADVAADEARPRYRAWLEEWRGQENRVVRVVGGWLAVPFYARRMAERLEGEFDAISPSGYFDPGKKANDFNDATTVDDVLDASSEYLENDTLPSLVKHAEVAKTWSEKTGRRIALICYEGGQHITTFGRKLPWQDKVVLAQSAPKMQACYERLLTGAREHGVELVCAFNYVGKSGPFGCWGHLEYQDSPEETSLKWQALLEFARPAP
jgi:hypothetical protein